MEEKVYVAWRNPNTKVWYPVALLSVKDKVYYFVYTKGASMSGFPRFLRMDKDELYTSADLFPLFNNRIMSERRPEFLTYLSWLDMTKEDASPLKMLVLTEGAKATDQLEFFQCPLRSEDYKYKISFMLHGLRYIPKDVLNRVDELREGERLYLVPDPQNEWHQDAMMLRTGDPVFLVGYCPRYLGKDFNKLLNYHDARAKDIEVSVKKINRDAPLNLRVLCQISAPWPEDFSPCSEEEYEPMLNELFMSKEVEPSRASVLGSLTPVR